MTLQNSQYLEIMKEYDEEQLLHKKELKARQEEVYAKVPEIKELDQELSVGSIAKMKELILSGTSISPESIKERNQILREKKKELLKKNGFSADYLEPIFTCRQCKDTGYNENQQKCTCLNQKIIKKLYAQSYIQRFLETENFDTFDFSYYSQEKEEKFPFSSYENIQNVYHKCKDYVKQFDNNVNNIIFTGSTGVGKTFLAKSIAKDLLDSGHTVLYLSAPKLLEQILPTLKKGGALDSELQGLSSYIYDAQLLIMDDLGTEYTTSYTITMLQSLLNERQLRNHATIITTNYSIHDIKEQYGERISSRILESFHVFFLYGQDIRYQKRERQMKQKNT
ncbi:MAG: ATP-binding protein [Lachnospiraceae bacterium]|nr:ATP-binding protein [Lachnospiraceae bacterium]